VKCPYCGHPEDRVLDSRPIRDGEAIKRRRECLACGRRFTTFEEIEELKLMVVKNDGRREPFDRNKVLRGMQVACEKRPISIDALEEIANDIEQVLINRGEREVKSSEIGELVMERLKQLDQVAYVRFASVYRQFEDATQFRELVNMLTRQRRQK
jgi:transcriptional repressor NrdR